MPVAELEDDGEDFVVKIFHLILWVPQPLKFIIWDLRGGEHSASWVFPCCQYCTTPCPASDII